VEIRLNQVLQDAADLGAFGGCCSWLAIKSQNPQITPAIVVLLQFVLTPRSIPSFRAARASRLESAYFVVARRR
jgi:hypothetical protein